MFKNFVSQKTVLQIGIAILAISLIAILFLSISINNNYETTYKDIIAKSFFQKTNALDNEFIEIDNHLESIACLAENTTLPNLRHKYEILNEIYNHGELIQFNWFIVLDEDHKVIASNFDQQHELAIESSYIQAIIDGKNKNAKNNFIQTEDKIYWLLWKEVKTHDNYAVITGFSFDTLALHKHLSTTDVTTPNYAYIFAEDGTCIYHPETSFIGTNVFTQKNILAEDTITPNTHSDTPVVLSEYLRMEVMRYIAHFETDNFKGYISVNFPKVNMDENLVPLKRNTYLIFTSSILLILIVFYFFTAETKKTYTEKEQIAVEKEKINKEKALMQLKQLKNQINPHFLFNSLNSLFMLIDMDKNLAQKFTLNLSKTYRYLITPPTDNIVELDQELTFIQHYINLQKIRFSKELFFEIKDERTQSENYKIPYLALQITVENALKHNIATVENPLLIQLIITDELVKVINNFQPKKHKEQGERFGLTYLTSIYNYYNETQYKAQQELDVFICILPLFKC